MYYPQLALKGHEAPVTSSFNNKKLEYFPIDKSTEAVRKN